MKKNKDKLLVAYSLIAVGLLYFIEQILIPGYLIKSISKILIFLVGAFLFQKIFKIKKKKNLLAKSGGSSLIKILVLGIGAFTIVLGTFAVLRTQIDLAGISKELENTLDINTANFIAVGIYITIVNAALEEFFFRGFLFMSMEKKTKRERLFAYVYSSLLFSFYHLSIFKTWFDLKLLVVALLGLVIAGTIFNYLDEKNDSIIYSYIVHACGDAGIIFIGLKMFKLF